MKRNFISNIKKTYKITNANFVANRYPYYILWEHENKVIIYFFHNSLKKSFFVIYSRAKSYRLPNVLNVTVAECLT